MMPHRFLEPCRQRSMMCWSPGEIVPWSARNEIDSAFPEFLAETNSTGNTLHAAVTGSASVSRTARPSVPKAAGQERATALARMMRVHLAVREIMEVEAKFWRHVEVGRLLVRQDGC